MKRYKRFMDGVRASDTLNQRLKALKEPKKKPAAWAKYGAAAAALILVFGGAALGMHWEARWSGRLDELFRQASYVPENVDEPRPDIALLGPGESVEPAATRFAGDYQVTRDGVTAHYLLPYIEYTEAGNPNRYAVAADWDIPAGAFRRDMSREHIAYLLGGEDALSTHLDWDGYELSGWAAWYGNGDFWGAYIQGYAGELDHFEFAVTANQLPPTCFEFPDVEEQNIHGLMVTAVGYDSTASTRQVSFMKDGYGYRFDLTGTDRELAEERVSRLVRLVADDGTRYLEWITDTMEPVMTANGDGTVTCQVCGETFPDRTHGDGSLSKHESETTICSICGQQVLAGGEKAHVHSFPGVGEPNWNDGAPAVSAEPRYTCPDCGVTYPVGEAHYHTQTCEICGRDYPVGSAHGHPFMGGDTETCPDCGASYPAGTDHQCEICGYPLAPDTHVCEVCGQTIPVGVEHSHQQEHHQEQHHGNHH